MRLTGIRKSRAVRAGLALAFLCAAPMLSTTTARAQEELCGDASGNGQIEASDALVALQVAVGTKTCPPPRCDCNASGGITASDAMDILKSAVGLDIELECPAPVVTTTSTTTSSTIPSSDLCGNGEVDEGEDCDEPGWFCRGACNADTGICVDFICSDSCTCPQPLCGDAMVDPGEDCDPPGSSCGGGTCGDRCECLP